jgi:hypothetical protein
MEYEAVTDYSSVFPTALVLERLRIAVNRKLSAKLLSQQLANKTIQCTLRVGIFPCQGQILSFYHDNNAGTISEC